MNERVVSLTDRGRGLEWLSLGFGIWLIASLAAAYLASDIGIVELPDGTRAISGLQPEFGLASGAVHLVATALLALGAGLLYRTGMRLWYGIALVSLAVLAVTRTWSIWVIAIGPDQFGDLRHHLSTIWIVGSFAHLVLVASMLQGLRQLAAAEEADVPVIIIGLAIGVEVVRVAMTSELPLAKGHTFFGDPWADAALSSATSAALSVVVIGLVLLAIRAASAAVAGQIWAGDLGVTSPARAADWQRTARGLDRFGAFLIGKIAIASAAIPLMIMAVLVGLGAFDTVRTYVVPVASALCSAGMAAGLVACRRVPDPPDARAGFTGAALLIAACLAADLYVLAARAGQPLSEAISSLGHLVAYLALLRSVGRIAERLGDSDLTRRARAYGRLAIVTVPGATISSFLLLRNPADLAAWIAVPVAMAAVSFAALLPCALLARQLARTLRARFAEPPRAVVRAS